jgi:uncharacterized protein
MPPEPATRRRRIVLGGLALLLICAGATLPLLPRDNSIQNMLPGDSGIHHMLEFLQDARFAGQVAVSFKRAPAVSFTEFTAAIDRTVASLDSPHIEQVIHKIDIPSAGKDITFFQQHLPSLMDDRDFSALTNRLNPSGVQRTLQNRFADLIKPGGSMALPLMRRDPFEIEEEFLSRLQELAASSGYTIEIKNGYLFSEDGSHALAVLETSAPVTDVAASHELLDAVNNALAGLPAGITADVVCGHRHAVSNEAILKRDVQRAVFAAAIGFLLLFALCFRDFRAQFIFVIPLASVLLSIHLCSWLTGPLSLFVLGFGVVIVGIAVDYGIHVYVAVRTAGNPDEARRAVVRPVVLGALTTLGVFIAFFAAGVPGYSQMAVFSIASILLSLAGALFVLPHLIKTNPPRRSGTPPEEGILRNLAARPSARQAAGRGGFGFFILWLLLLVLLVTPFPRLSFDSDLRALDGSGEAVWNAEERFREIWGSGAETLALAVVEAPDADTALALNDRLYAAVRGQGDADGFSSFSSVWKSRAKRTENAARWNRFWTPGRIAEVRTMMDAANIGFKPDAFDPFFQTLETPAEAPDEPADNQIFQTLENRFTQSLGGAHQLVSFFPDTAEWMTRVKNALNATDALLISRREIDRVLSDETVRTVKRVASLAVVLVLLFTVVLMRRPREILPALLPAAVSVIAVLKILHVTGMAINIPTLISGIVVIGLSIDYGIFMVYGCKRETLNEVRTAVTLSALTSLVGAGVLLLTRHPALFSIGVTLVAGLTAGVVTALCAVPFLARFLFQEKE